MRARALVNGARGALTRLVNYAYLYEGNYRYKILTVRLKITSSIYRRKKRKQNMSLKIR